MFSVVIASRDRATLLQQAVASLADQTLPPSAVIVVDDGSTDETWDWLSGLDCERLVAIRTEGVGVSDARNRGLEAVTTPWVVFLDDDDTPDSRWLQELSALIAEDVGIVSCAVTINNAERSIRYPTEQRDLHGKVLLLTGAFATRSTLLREVGGYMSGLTYAENSELALRLLGACQVHGLRAAHSDTPLLTISQAEHRRSKFNRHHALIKVVDAHRSTFEDDPERLARWLSIAGVDAFRAGDQRLARRIFARALRSRLTPVNAARLLLACAPTLGRRVWGPTDDEPSSDW